MPPYNDADAEAPVTSTADTTTTTSATATRTTRVLTPASLRLDSRVLWAHTSFVWTTNCIFCIFIMEKLNKTWAGASWWVIFTPLFVGHALHIPLLVWVLCTVNQRMLQQLGPPPPRRASMALHSQFIALRAVAVRSHLVDNANALLDSAALLIVKIQFAHLLNIGQFQSTSLRVVFAPIWAVWVVTLLLVCAKHRRERVIGSQRDFAYVFLLMVAFKVDGESSLPWPVVFVVPWIWLCVVLLLGVVVAVSLSCARGWTRLKDAMMPVGFMLLLFSTGIPQFAFCRNLVARLDGDHTITFESILIPAAVGWAAMWLSSGILAMGLRNRERMREALLASGAVWTAHEALARGLQPAAMREEEQQRVDAMTEDEVVDLAQRYMRTRGVVPPPTLVRVGPSLFKRPPDVVVVTNATQPPQPPPQRNNSAGTATDPLQPTTASSNTITATDPLQTSPSSTPGSTPGSKVSAAVATTPPLATAPGGTAPMAEPVRSQQVSILLGSGDAGTQGQQTPVVSTSSEAGRQQSTSGQARVPSGTMLLPAPPAHATGRAHSMMGGGSGRAQSGTAAFPGASAASGPLPQLQQLPQASPAVSCQQLPDDLLQGLPDGLLQGPTSGFAALLGMPEADVLGAMPQPGAGARGGEEADDGTCCICFDAQATCVLLDCGHGGFCRRCAHLLLVRPPNVCPTCRQQIDMVVQLEQVGNVGQTCTIKPVSKTATTSASQRQPPDV